MKSVSDVAIEDAEAILRACPEWFHSIELAPGIVTPGRSPVESCEALLRSIQLPDLHGKSVLDIGTYDGFFAFAAERLGAARIVALDHYVWSVDVAEYMKDWRESKRTGTLLSPPHESRHWHPDELPGRRPFDSVHKLFGSKVEPVVGDFMEMNLAELGQFDVVLYLGVLYHMEEPLRAIRRVGSVTAPHGLAVIETEAMEIPGLEGRPLCEFFPGQELNNDATNWWAPNAAAVEGFCKAAGFREVALLSEQPNLGRSGHAKAMGSFLSRTRIAGKLAVGVTTDLSPLRYRLKAHARR